MEKMCVCVCVWGNNGRGGVGGGEVGTGKEAGNAQKQPKKRGPEDKDRQVR